MNFSKLVSVNWYKNYNNWLPLAQWLGWLIVVILLAKMFWVWALYFSVPTEFKPIKVNSGSTVQSNSKVNVSTLIEKNLFGSIVQQQEEQKVEEVEVAETKLNLKLKGIYAADITSKANAIIEDARGKQAVYFIDEKLNVSGRVYLRQVYVDRVILETNGRREALRLEQQELAIKLVNSPAVEAKVRRTKNNRKIVEDKRKNARLSQKLNDYRNKLANDPRSVSDVINGRPHYVNGELQGFSVQPGRDKRLFQELGLRRNDVITSINGVGLTNIQDAMTLMNDAKSLKEVNVEVQRGAQQLNLLLNLNENVGRR